MRRVWLSLWMCSALVGLAVAQNNDFSKVQIKVQKVGGSVYMLQGAGGNIGASVGEDGIVIVDDEYAPLAEKIQAALKGITDKPVRFIINTHYHGDHTGGNITFQQEKSPIIAQENVRKRLASGGTAGNGGTIKMNPKPADPKALPIITFDHDVTVHLNGEDIRALHFPHGHTDGDSVIYFPESNVVHMGDDFVTYGFPFIDIDAGGSVVGLIADIEEILPKLPPDVKLIPGHGPVSNVEDLKNFLAMVKGSVAAVQGAIKAGKTLDQMKQEKIMAPYAKYDGDFIKADQWIETIYNDLSGKPGEFIRHN
jgi:cyclase